MSLILTAAACARAESPPELPLPPLEPETARYEDLLYELPRKMLGIDFEPEARASRWAAYEALLARLDSDELRKDIPMKDMPNPRGGLPSYLRPIFLLYESKELTIAQQKHKAAVERVAADLQAEGFFTDLHEFVRAGPVLRPKSKHPSYFTPKPDYFEVQLLSSVLTALARRAIAAGHCERATDLLNSARILASTCIQASDMTGVGVGLWIDGYVFQAIDELVKVHRNAFNEPCLQLLLEISTPRPKHAIAPYIFEAERLRVLQTIEYVYVSGPDGNRIDCDRLDRIYRDLSNEQCRQMRDHQSATQDAEEKCVRLYFDYAKSVADRQPSLTHNRYEGLFEQYEVICRTMGSIGGYVFFTMLSGLDNALMIIDQHKMRESANCIVLALELHRARHGGYPTSLGELVPGEIAEPIADLYAAEGPLRYRRVGEGKDADYLLYSVGLDGTDNDGRADPDQPDIALRSQDSGLDWVIHRPDEVATASPP